MKNLSIFERDGSDFGSKISQLLISEDEPTIAESTVTRRFSDFLGLHDKLSDKYLQNGRVIPPAPDKSVVNMTKV